MNIAEGSARTDAEFSHFLRIALGSAAELEYQLWLARDLGYITTETHDSLLADLAAVKAMLVQFRKTVRPEDRPATGASR